MSNEAISEDTFVREYVRELRNRNAAVFVGAGLSTGSGYVDWKGLLEDIIRDLKLDPDKEYDLVTVAQYYCNQTGSRGQLTQTIFDYISQTKAPTENHRLLASLPIQTYWTTNYDKLIENALSNAKKVPDIKSTLKHLAVTRPKRNVLVYKMHGDIDDASQVVITKDDYEKYPLKMDAFISALRGDLIEKTFLFLGLSFTDPNIDYVLSRVRALYEKDQRQHYCILKKTNRRSKESKRDFEYRELKQHYFIKDLKRFAVQTVLVDDYPDITRLLRKVSDQYKRKSVFVSGAADQYGKWKPSQAQDFLFKLSYQIAAKGNRIVTGFGVGVGSPIINGSLAYLNDSGRTITDDDIVMRPFPQSVPAGRNIGDVWREYRKAMITHAGIAIFVFGNKLEKPDKIVLSNGMKEEFDLCLQAGVKPIPVGATGFMAESLWNDVRGNFEAVFPESKRGFRKNFEMLNDKRKTPTELIKITQEMLNRLQKG